MAAVCREFGISRKTGYKLFYRYKDPGLEDRSRRPYRHANKLPFQIERAILGIKRDRSSWGAPKILEKLTREYPVIKPPAGGAAGNFSPATSCTPAVLGARGASYVTDSGIPQT